MNDVIEKTKRILKNEFRKGDRVTYTPTHTSGNKNHPDCRHGVVSSMHDGYIFVKYDNKVQKMVTGDEPYTSQATSRKDLVYESRR